MRDAPRSAAGAAWPVLSVLALIVAGCRHEPAPITIHLVDLFRPEQVLGRSAAKSAPLPRTEWRFDAPAAAGTAAGRWEAGPGVVGLAVRDGRLEGRTTSAAAIVHLVGRPASDGSDTAEELEIRLRVSAGANLFVSCSGQEHVDLAEIAAQAANAWFFATPIIAGDDLRTYVVRIARAIPLSRTRHIFIRPTDAAGARFEIESLRLVSRREHLASVPSGISWQGLSELYRETIVARTPETVRFSLTLPARPRLDLAVGTLEDEPVTFRVAVGDPGAEAVLLERTVTTPHRWDPGAVDLGPYAGRRITLALSLSGGKPGLLGLWGAVIVRSLGAMPRAAMPAKAAGDPPQGVVLVWVDTLRRDHLEVYGYGRETGPAVRRMAAEGTLFRDQVVQATWTKVSTPSVLTSLYPSTHGVRDFSDRLPNSAVTLAEVYREAGYATLSMSSGLFTGRFTNLHKGFEEVQENGSIKGELRTSKTARVYVDRLLPWIEAHREVPFFVFLHVQDPHDPYRPYPPYDTLWADQAGEAEHERQANEVRKVIADPLMKGFLMPARDDLLKAGLDPKAYADYERGWYDGSIRGMDVEIARLLQGLRNLQLDRRTLVVFTADHGEEFLEHGRMFHGQTTYGELSNVPLILWRPGTVPAGRVVEQTVQSIDLMPTLLEMSRLPVPAAAQGHSLLPLLAQASRSSSPAQAAGARTAWPAVIEKAPTQEGGGPPPRDSASYAIIVDSWKLVRNVKRQPGRPEYELYNHRTDPLDAADVAADHPDVVQRLGTELQAWQRKAEAARLRPDSQLRQGLGKEELERLRSLGYIQ
ncbi:MAG TPA: sulfatase [Thermoanaerobaculia bacterium]|nr:sulfatase [Thermoanaerobaculia bacterium]